MLNREQSAERLFVAALELAPEQRSAFLDEACRNAPELRRTVEALLADDDGAGNFLAEPLLCSGQRGRSFRRYCCAGLTISARVSGWGATPLSSLWVQVEWVLSIAHAMRSWNAW
jgi:hypothetical protein